MNIDAFKYVCWKETIIITLFECLILVFYIIFYAIKKITESFSVLNGLLLFGHILKYCIWSPQIAYCIKCPAKLVMLWIQSVLKCCAYGFCMDTDNISNFSNLAFVVCNTVSKDNAFSETFRKCWLML